MAATVFTFCRSCRSKLKRAAQMRMAAFCGPTCFGKYYAARCRVCDKAIKADKLKPGRNAVQLCGRGHRLEYQRERLRYQFLRAQNPSKQGDIAKRPKIADLPPKSLIKWGCFRAIIYPSTPTISHR